MLLDLRDISAGARKTPLSIVRPGHMPEHEIATDEGSRPPTLLRAAEYVRMSTEHQQYSTENQGDKIREYAARRGIEIIRTYADEGKSGLRIDGRAALQRLMENKQVVRYLKQRQPEVLVEFETIVH